MPVLGGLGLSLSPPMMRGAGAELVVAELVLAELGTVGCGCWEVVPVPARGFLDDAAFGADGGNNGSRFDAEAGAGERVHSAVVREI